MSDDIYTAPEASLSNSAERMGGNIDDAVAGDIRIKTFETLAEAWRGVKGFKMSCHLAFFLYFIIAIIASMISLPVIIGLSAIGADETVVGWVSWLIQMAASLAVMPMFFGIHIMGIRQMAGKPVSSGVIFHFFHKIPQLLLTYSIMIILIFIGFILLILPGIYLTVAYMFAMPLVIEKNMPAWQALETSRKAIGKNWLATFGLLLMLMLINTLALLTLGIAWIWTVPWSILAMSLVHYRLFGAEAQTLTD